MQKSGRNDALEYHSEVREKWMKRLRKGGKDKGKQRGQNSEPSPYHSFQQEENWLIFDSNRGLPLYLFCH